MPVCSAAPCPRLIGCRTTTAPASNATSPVRSPEPSSTTTTASPARRMPDTTVPTTGASLYAATTTQGLRIRPVMSHQLTTSTRPQAITAIPTRRRADSGSANTRAPRTGVSANATATNGYARQRRERQKPDPQDGQRRIEHDGADKRCVLQQQQRTGGQGMAVAEAQRGGLEQELARRHAGRVGDEQCDLAEIEALDHGRPVSGRGGALLKTTRIASNRFTGMANRLPVGLAAI